MIASTILSLTVLLAPQPPEGPLPWGVGIPAVPSTTAPSIVLDEIEHSESYEDQQDEIETQIDEWTQPMNTLNTMLGLWIGDSGTMPDASEGDFEMGMVYLDDVGTAYDLAHWMGEHIETMFSYVRVASSLPGVVFGTLLTATLICATVILAIKGFDFALALFDAVYVVGRDIVMLIGAYFPTGG